MEKKLIYLASPYSHKKQDIRAWRFEQVCLAAGSLTKQGFFIFSPIAMSHPIAELVEINTAFSYWKELDELMIDRCDVLVVLQLDGWEASIGVTEEVKYAYKTGKDVYFLPPNEVDIFAEKAGKNLLWKQSESVTL